MSGLGVIAPAGSRHPLVTAARDSGLRLMAIEPGAEDGGTMAGVGPIALIVASGLAVDALVTRIEAAADGERPVLVAPDPSLLQALGQRLEPRAAARVHVACASRLEPPAVAISGAVAAGTLGLPWGIHVEALGDPRSPAESALDLADLVSQLTGSSIRSVERLGDGHDPLLLVPELEHGILASLTIAGSDPEGTPPRGDTPRLLVRLDASHGQASADLLSPALHLPVGPTRFGPTGHGLLLDAVLAGTAPADLRLPDVLVRLAPVITSIL